MSCLGHAPPPPAPSCPHLPPASGPAIHLVGWAWSTLNIAQHGWTVLMALGPILLGLGAILQGYVAVRRLQFDRMKDARDHVPPPAAPPTPRPGPRP